MFINETSKYIYKITKKQIFVFTKDDFLIKRIDLPKKERVLAFADMYFEIGTLKVIFDTNDNYQYKATLNEENFEFSDWGFTK